MVLVLPWFASLFGGSIGNRIHVASAWDVIAKVTAPANPIRTSLAQCAPREVVVGVECHLMLARTCGTLNFLLEWPALLGPVGQK